MRRACLAPIVALVGACGVQDLPFDPADADVEAGVEAGAEDNLDAKTKAGCSNDFDCPLRGQHCDSSGQCVACVTNSDCSTQPGHPRCDDLMLHQCVECLSDFDCPGGFCEPTAHRCVFSCADGGSCPDYYQHCTPAGVCVTCMSNPDCVGARGGQICDVKVGQCVECLINDQCSSDKPLCNPATLRCVECLSNQDCGTGEACSFLTHSCVDLGTSGFYDGGSNVFLDGSFYETFDGGGDGGFR